MVSGDGMEMISLEQRKSVKKQDLHLWPITPRQDYGSSIYIDAWAFLQWILTCLTSVKVYLGLVVGKWWAHSIHHLHPSSKECGLPNPFTTHPYTHSNLRCTIVHFTSWKPIFWQHSCLSCSLIMSEGKTQQRALSSHWNRLKKSCLRIVWTQNISCTRLMHQCMARILLHCTEWHLP